MSFSSDEVLIEAKSELRLSPLDVPLNELHCYLQNRNSFFFSKHLHQLCYSRICGLETLTQRARNLKNKKQNDDMLCEFPNSESNKPRGLSSAPPQVVYFFAL